MDINLASPRQILRNGMAEILHLTAGNTLAAWNMADQYLMEMSDAVNVGRAAIRESMIGLGQQALRAVAVEQYTEVDFGTLNAEEEAAFDAIEAQAQANAAKAQEAEAERINRAHPSVFNMVDFAANVCGMKRS